MFRVPRVGDTPVVPRVRQSCCVRKRGLQIAQGLEAYVDGYVHTLLNEARVRNLLFGIHEYNHRTSEREYIGRHKID